MSYTMTVTFLCEMCGTTAVQDNLLTPKGWTREDIYGEAEGWHRCKSCSEKVGWAVKVAVEKVKSESLVKS